jgi:uncharacterized repeat protein (TIGR01451 family)
MLTGRRVAGAFQLLFASILLLTTVPPSKAQVGYNFVPVTPCRIADTRGAIGPLGGPTAAGGSTRSFLIPASSCGIPLTAAAYSLNVTVIPQQTLGYLTIWPTGAQQPTVSTLNSIDGRIKANAAIVPAGAGGAVSVYVTDSTDVILDINGYFLPPAAAPFALAFYPVSPCRLVDTRSAPGALAGPTMNAGQTRTFPVLSGSCNIPSSAQAYSLNFTAVPQGPLGYLAVWPAGEPQPPVSTLNALTGEVTANAAIVPAGSGGSIDAFVTNNADLIVDINGYFAPPSSEGLSFYPMTPCRVIDSRAIGSGQPFSGMLNVSVNGGACGAMPSAQAFTLNATVVPSVDLGYLTVWPQGTAQPLVSTLNAGDGAITSNMAIVPTNNGSISAFATDPTQLICDISGYFALYNGIAGPVITSISPYSVSINSPDTVVTIHGYGFTGATTVEVNGNAVNVIGWNPNFVLFKLPASYLTSVGYLSVTAANPGPALSNSVIIGVILTPAPTLTSISPTSAAVGGPSLTLDVYGSNFAATSVVQWNGAARPTTFVNSGVLTATIFATDIQSLGTSAVTVFSPAPGGGLSAAVPFATFVGLQANDLVYSPSTQLLYASVPSAGGSVFGNSIVPIDPNTGTLGTPIFVGSEPGRMALSSDGGTIWVALTGAAVVREVNLQTQTAGLQFGLGGGTGLYNPPSNAQTLAVMPGHPNTVAVAAPGTGAYTSQVTIYDSGVARANAANGAVQCCSGVTGLAFDPTGTYLYEAGNGYGVATVNSTGITSATSLNAGVSSNDLHVDSGRAYLTDGVILDANLGTQLGVFSVGPGQDAMGPVTADSTVGEGFVLVNPNFVGAQIDVYSLSTFVLNGSISLPGISGNVQTDSLTRWSQDGLAFAAGGQVYILRSKLVRDLSSSLADLSVAASAPASGTTGTNLTYGLTISNAGPLAATPATLTDDIPSGSTLQSVTTSQGTCSGATIVYCDLGNLNSGSSATVQITVTPLSAGTLTNTASVTAPQGDPNTANNSAVSTTTVTGSTYSSTPAITSISPAFVQAGSSSFTLTVNGSGFASNSTVQFNSAALPTTFVNASQLTATVGASSVSSLGWAWINVTTPLPGGGTTSNVPLTVYQVVSLDVNRMNFDPYTRKLYATLPSTATQVTGNSLVAIDPVTGSIGTPLNVGSEPNPLSESSDGNRLYIGLGGSESLTFVNLPALTQGPVFPIDVGTGQGSQVAARDLAVAPGNDNLLAIDTGSYSGIGLFDISGSTGTMRPTLSGPYTGSSLAFANGSTLYSYDSDTSGEEFRIWTVTSTGLTLNNNTGYTFNGIGGYNGAYKLDNGLVYGFSGGAVNPTTTPPTQLGEFEVSAAEGSNQTVEGSGVAPDLALGRVFFLGETVAGTANPVLLSYDSSRYLLLNTQQFTGAAEGMDLLRWGRDGLAWHTSTSGAFGNSTPGSGQVFLMRGPFVLPEWSTVNPTPGLVSVSPSSAATGSGNLTLTVTGTNFVPGAVLLWNGAERSTTFVDSAHLTVAIPASDVSQSGTANLVVNNPGASNSSSTSFNIQ